MDVTEQLLSQMEELRNILEEERSVLIENNGERLVEIISEKETLIEKLTEFDEEDVEVSYVQTLTYEIKELQETNLTLTQQSLSFTEQLLDNIQKNAIKSNTYSNQGKHEKADPTFLDQSL